MKKVSNVNLLSYVSAQLFIIITSWLLSPISPWTTIF